MAVAARPSRVTGWLFAGLLLSRPRGVSRSARRGWDTAESAVAPIAGNGRAGRRRVGLTAIGVPGVGPVNSTGIRTVVVVPAPFGPRKPVIRPVVDVFAANGVTSFDSTSAFRQSFKDDTDNFYALDWTYTALRVPQVDGNPKLKARIRAGQVPQGDALPLERHCLESLRGYDRGAVKIGPVLHALSDYDRLCDGTRKDRTETYRRTLEDQPWRSCHCGLCETVGIEIALFRGSERNKRRGFHNLHVFRQRLRRELEGTAA
jgi:hypothetical protein